MTAFRLLLNLTESPPPPEPPPARPIAKIENKMERRPLTAEDLLNDIPDIEEGDRAEPEADEQEPEEEEAEEEDFSVPLSATGKKSRTFPPGYRFI